MNTFLISIDATTTVNGATPPTLEVLVGGVVVSSVSMNAGGDTYNLFIEYTGAVPSSVTLRFNAGSGDPADTITFTGVTINGDALNLGTDLTATMLSQGSTSGVTATAETYGHTTPTLGAPTITGTGGDDDTLSGGNAADVIDGLAGNDRIRGKGDDDAINGGNGDDYIFGEDGADTILGGAGNDIIFGNADDDILYGEADNDFLIGGDGNDVLNGGAGTDGLLGDAGDDIMFGEDGDDWLSGDAGDDIMFGDDGNDFLIGGIGNDALSGGDGNDQLVGDEGNDLLNGGAGVDEIFGGIGNDTISAGDGNDEVYGGDGVDEIAGGNNDDYISGGDGADTLDGDSGADVVNGGDGADTINGGVGNDILHGHGLDADAISAILNANPNIVYSQESNSFYQYVNTGARITHTAAEAAASASTLNGLNGHLAVITSQAEQTFIESIWDNSNAWIAGSDSGTEGVWEWDVGAESGIQFSDATGNSVNGMFESWEASQPNDGDGTQDFAYMLFSGGSTGWADAPADPWAAIPTFVDINGYFIEWDAGLMNSDNAVDTINGGDGDDDIFGYGGNDVLSGGNNNDLIFGGAGNDTVNGDAGDDILNGGEGNDTIDGGADNDVLYGSIAGSASFAGAFTVSDVLAANPNVVYNAATGNFYQFVNTGLSTTHAAATAAAAGNLINGVAAHLATLGDAAEQTFVGNIINGGLYAWVDGTDSAAEGTFRYSSGPEAGNVFDAGLNWFGGSPASSNSGTRDNVLIWDGGGDVLFAFTAGSNAYGYIAEWEGASVLNAGTLTITGYDSTSETNTLNGGTGNDTLNGSLGNDILNGDAGNDTLNGDFGDDTLNAGTGNDVLNGGAGDDTLQSTTTQTTTFTPTVADILAANPTLSYNATTGNFYEYVNNGANSTTFAAAQAQAASNTVNGAAAHLVTLTDAAEQTFVGGLINGGEYAWISGSDAVTEMTHLWTDGPENGTALSGALNWWNGSPANSNALNPNYDNIIIWDGGGDVLFAFDATFNAFGYIAEWEGTDVLVPTTVFINTSADTVTLNGGDGFDTLYGGAGIDTFVFEAANAYNDIDHVEEFVSGAGGDVLDISDLLTGFAGPITDWLNFEVSGANTLVQVDGNGTTGGTNFITIAQINNQTGFDEAAMLANGNLIV